MYGMISDYVINANEPGQVFSCRTIVVHSLSNAGLMLVGLVADRNQGVAVRFCTVRDRKRPLT